MKGRNAFHLGLGKHRLRLADGEHRAARVAFAPM
jgi:hypothetical protein